MKIKIKKWDIVIIVMLLILSFLPYGFAKLLLGQQTSQVYAYITVEGEFYKEIPLTGQVDRKEFWIETSSGKNKIVIENESIAIEEADCTDHLCEQFGHQKNPGDIIVCLPHQIYIEVKGTAAQNQDKESIDAIGY